MPRYLGSFYHAPPPASRSVGLSAPLPVGNTLWNPNRGPLRISTRHRSPAGNRNLTFRVAERELRGIILPFLATQAQGGAGGSQGRKASPTHALAAEPRSRRRGPWSRPSPLAGSIPCTAVLDPGASAAGHCTLREAAAEGVAGGGKRAARALSIIWSVWSGYGAPDLERVRCHYMRDCLGRAAWNRTAWTG